MNYNKALVNRWTTTVYWPSVEKISITFFLKIKVLSLKKSTLPKTRLLSIWICAITLFIAKKSVFYKQKSDLYRRETGKISKKKKQCEKQPIFLAINRYLGYIILFSIHFSWLE